MAKIFATIGIIALFAIILLQSTQATNALTRLIASGDFGGNSAAVTNLKNIDSADICVLGLGDYMYNYHPRDSVKGGGTLGGLWDDIRCKVGFPGNHEELKHQEEVWAQQTFKYSSQGYGAWKLRDIGIIGISAYADFEKGSSQYDFVTAKVKDFAQREDIKHIVFVTHEPLWTPSVSGGHGPNVDLRNTYGDLIKKYNGFLIQAHNHVMAFGNVDGVNQVICGMGGYGGDSVSKLSGWEWATTKAGYCALTFKDDGSITTEFVDTKGQIIKVHTFTPTSNPT